MGKVHVGFVRPQHLLPHHEVSTVLGCGRSPSATAAAGGSTPALCPQDRTSRHASPAPVALDERGQRPGGDLVEAADVHGLDLA